MPVAPSCNRALAAASASSRRSTMCPRGTATPYFERMAFAWYSCIFIFYDERERTVTLTRAKSPQKDGVRWGPRTAPLLRLDEPDCLLLTRMAQRIGNLRLYKMDSRKVNGIDGGTPWTPRQPSRRCWI